MRKGNVLVLGNSGAGKSTLINAVFQSELAETASGRTEGVTKRLKVYEKESMPFNLIDTVGFEPGFLRNYLIVREVKHFFKKVAKKNNQQEYVNMIWFCIDGTSPRLFDKTINDFIGAIKGWNSVPICIVITKAYSSEDTKLNEEVVKKVIEKRRINNRVVGIIPVVAKPYVIDDNKFKEPFGLEKLIECTNTNMPEGFVAAKNDVERFILEKKRTMANAVVSLSTIAGASVCALPFPIPDAAPLTAIERGEVMLISKIYGLDKDFGDKKVAQYLIELGSIAAIGKQVTMILKAIPGINLGAIAINTIVGGTIVASIGKVAQFSCEEVYLGNKTVDDLDWIKKLLESEFSKGIQGKFKDIAERIRDADSMTAKEIASIIIEEFFKKDKT